MTQRVLKACVHYFSLFLKEQCFLVISNKILSPGLPRATRLLETSCLPKITVCVIKRMLVMLPLVLMNKARREVPQQIKYKSTQDKIVTVLRTNLNDWKNILRLFKSSSKSTYCNSLNPWLTTDLWRIFAKHTFLLHFYLKKFKI